MVRVTAVLMLAQALFLSGTADAQVTGFRVPRVYGDTSRPLPPARALQVYQQRYGRPWHGLGGRFVRTYPPTRGYGVLSPHAAQRHYVYHVPNVFVPVFSSWGPAYGGWATRWPANGGWGTGWPVYRGRGWGTGWPVYGGWGWGTGWGGFSSTGTILNVGPAGPIFTADDSATAGDRLLPDLPALPQQAAQRQPVRQTVFRRTPQASSPAARRRATRVIADGDDDLRRQQPTAARQHYHQAILATPDRALPRFRTAMAEILLGRYDQAVTLLKQGLELDPDWPHTGESLDELLGPDNGLLKTLLIEKVSGWVKQRLRSPDRLFLLGVLLHFDSDKKNSRLLFRTAWKLGDRGQHLAAFLDPVAR